MQGRFSLLILTLKILILFPIPSPTSPSQAQTLPHYILVKSKKTGGKLRINFKNIFQMFMKRNAGKEIGTSSDPLPYPIIPVVSPRKMVGKFWEMKGKIPPVNFCRPIIKWGGICSERRNLEGCRKIKDFVPGRTNGFVSGHPHLFERIKNPKTLANQGFSGFSFYGIILTLRNICGSN